MNQEEYKEIINKYKEENKELIESGKCKHVFLECLPTKICGNRFNIDWTNSIGYNVYLIYNKYECFVKIVDVKNNYVTVEYNNKEHIFDKGHFKDCKVGRMFNVVTKNFKINIGETIVDEKRDLVIIDREHRIRERKDNYKESQKWYKYYCMKCGNEDWIEESKLLTSKRSCNRCEGSKVDGTNCIANLYPELIEYFVDKEYPYTHRLNSQVNTYVKCPKCGYIKKMRVRNLYYSGFACPKCSDGISYPNKFMANILSELNIDFETEYSPTWCVFYNKFKNKDIRCRYDFYFKHNDNKYIIEMDGGWHTKDNKLSGISAEESKEIDLCKDNLAKEHNIEVIRIDCGYRELLDRFKYVKDKIIDSELKNILNLNNINWDKIDAVSQKSKLLEVCNYWNEVSKDKKEISKVFNISTTTINTYLHKGEELGLCKYEDMIKNTRPESKMKSIKCTTTGECFKCIKDIPKEYNIVTRTLYHVCNPNSRCRYTGTLNGQKLEWCYITKEEYNNYIDSLNK